MADTPMTTNDYSRRHHEDTRNDSGVDLDNKLEKLTLNYGGPGSGVANDRRIAVPKSRKRNDILPCYSSTRLYVPCASLTFN